MNENERGECLSPVGMFDSGVGGISVLREAVRLLPNERFIFYGDTKNAPYGTKTREAVLALSRQVVKELLGRKCKAIVIACNTATSAAAADLRAEYPELPIIAMEPALKPASLLHSDARHHRRRKICASVRPVREGRGFAALPRPDGICGAGGTGRAGAEQLF